MFPAYTNRGTGVHNGHNSTACVLQVAVADVLPPHPLLYLGILEKNEMPTLQKEARA